MSIDKNISIAEKKKEVLSKVSDLLAEFQKLKENLLSIIETNEQLKKLNKEEERRKILETTNENLRNLMNSIEAFKKAHYDKSKNEIQELHFGMKKLIKDKVSSILKETKLRAIISVSVNLPKLVEDLGKTIRSCIGVEILASSHPEKFQKIQDPIDIEKIRLKIEEQIRNIDSRTHDIKSICKVMEYLDINQNDEILNELVDFILGGKDYNHIEKSLKKHGIIIEEVTILPVKGSEDFSEPPIIEKTLKPEKKTQQQIIEKQNNLDEIVTLKPIQKQEKKSKGLGLWFKTLGEWLNTDKTVGWKEAKEIVLKREVN